MLKLVFIFFLFSMFMSAQTVIGKVNGASVTLEDARYEVIFQSEEDNNYMSFYMNQGEGNEDGLTALKTYVFKLFEEQAGDYLLQFVDDSVLLVYKNNKVQMVLWKQHNGDQRYASKWFAKTDYLVLFGEISKIQKM